jgi:hypothetical protein
MTGERPGRQLHAQSVVIRRQSLVLSGGAGVIAQQAISTISNVDDIETHIRVVEGIRGTIYLEAIDLAGEIDEA